MINYKYLAERLVIRLTCGSLSKPAKYICLFHGSLTLCILKSAKFTTSESPQSLFTSPSL